MTVSISINNGREAIVVADAQVSSQQRQSNSADKIGVFNGATYNGVASGTGDGNRIYSVLRNLHRSAPNLAEFVEGLQRDHRQRIRRDQQQVLRYSRESIDIQADLLDDDEARRRFAEAEIGKAIDQHRHYDNEDNTTHMVVTGFDATQNRIRTYHFNGKMVSETDTEVSAVGSGLDAADLYLNSRLQGVQTSQLSKPQLLFLAVNAYSSATMNQGVGGTPKIAHIEKGNTALLSHAQATSLCNVSAHYLAELLETTNDARAMLDHISSLLAPRPPYAQIARRLGLTRSSLTETIIPYSSVQERANRRLFRT